MNEHLKMDVEEIVAQALSRLGMLEEMWRAEREATEVMETIDQTIDTSNKTNWKKEGF